MTTDTMHVDTPFSFALNQTFIAFMKKWPCRLDKKIMIETWANTALNNGIESTHIAAATQYCVNNLKDWPSVYKFKIYCERAAAGLPLNEPIITQAEELAHEILSNLPDNPAFKDNLATYSDALLIAAIAVHQASQGKAFINSPLASEAVSWRFGMFVKEFAEWFKSAKQDANFWLARFLHKHL
jgi:hypothetical protein